MKLAIPLLLAMPFHWIPPVSQPYPPWPEYVIGPQTPPDAPHVKARYRAMNEQKKAADAIAAEKRAENLARARRRAKMPFAERADREAAGQERPR